MEHWRSFCFWWIYNFSLKGQKSLALPPSVFTLAVVAAARGRQKRRQNYFSPLPPPTTAAKVLKESFQNASFLLLLIPAAEGENFSVLWEHPCASSFVAQLDNPASLQIPPCGDLFHFQIWDRKDQHWTGLDSQQRSKGKLRDPWEAHPKLKHTHSQQGCNVATSLTQDLLFTDCIWHYWALFIFIKHIQMRIWRTNVL